LVEIIALAGTESVNGSTIILNFTGGVAKLYLSNQTFFANDLSTWGFSPTATPVDVKNLKPPEPVSAGNNGAYNPTFQTADAVNHLSTSVVAGSNVIGTALFLNAGTDIWANRTTDGVPSGDTTSNGAVADLSYIFQDSSNTTFDPTGNANNLTIANAIFANFGPSDTRLLANNGQFASGFNDGSASGYNPDLSSGGTATGDFASQVSVNVAPTIEAAPNPLADLRIQKTDSVGGTFNPSTNNTTGGHIVPGQDNTVVYTILVTNDGPDPAVNQTVTDNDLTSIPGLVSDSWTGTDGSSGTGNISDTIASLAPGASVTYTVTAVIHPAASATASFSNTASVTLSNGDTTPADNTSTDTISLSPQYDLAIKKTDDRRRRLQPGHEQHHGRDDRAGPGQHGALHHRGQQQRPEHGRGRAGHRQ
jgi:hypothetical protein